MRHAVVATIISALLTCGCASRQAVTQAAAPRPAPAPVAGPQARVLGGTATDLPRAVAYRTNGDYTDRVAVTLTPDGKLASYPAPTDISASARPLRLHAGFLLDRRGVNARSVFTRYTFDEYAALTAAPSPDSILAAIIPGSAITELLPLPMTTNEAVADTAAVNAYIKELQARQAIR